MDQVTFTPSNSAAPGLPLNTWLTDVTDLNWTLVIPVVGVNIRERVGALRLKLRLPPRRPITRFLVILSITQILSKRINSNLKREKIRGGLVLLLGATKP